MLIDNEKLALLSENVLGEGVKARVKAEGVLEKIIKTVEAQQKDLAMGLPPQGIFVSSITPYRKPKGGSSDPVGDKAVLGDSPHVANAANIRNFIQQVKERGWQYQEVVGAWEGKLEPSYVVYGKEDDNTLADLSKMAAEFNQDSIGYAGKNNGYKYAFSDLNRGTGTYSPGYAPEKGQLTRDGNQDVMMQRARKEEPGLGFTTTAKTPFSKTEPTTAGQVNKWETAVKNPQNDSPKYKKRLIKVLKKTSPSPEVKPITVQ